MSSQPKKKRSVWADNLFLAGGAIFCLLYGGFSLYLGGAAVITGRLSLSVYWQGTRRGGGDHLWSEEPGMFLFALILVLAQGGLVFWMGCGLAKAIFTKPHSEKEKP